MSCYDDSDEVVRDKWSLAPMTDKHATPERCPRCGFTNHGRVCIGYDSLGYSRFCPNAWHKQVSTGEPTKVLRYEDIDRISSTCDPTAIYRCTCGGHHSHTQACKDANMKRIEEHKRHASDIERGDGKPVEQVSTGVEPRRAEKVEGELLSPVARRPETIGGDSRHSMPTTHHGEGSNPLPYLLVVPRVPFSTPPETLMSNDKTAPTLSQAAAPIPGETDPLDALIAKWHKQATESRKEAGRIRRTVNVSTEAEANCYIRSEVWDKNADELESARAQHDALVSRRARGEKAEIEAACILELMGDKNHLARVHIGADSEWEVHIIADRQSVEEEIAKARALADPESGNWLKEKK